MRGAAGGVSGCTARFLFVGLSGGVCGTWWGPVWGLVGEGVGARGDGGVWRCQWLGAAWLWQRYLIFDVFAIF